MRFAVLVTAGIAASIAATAAPVGEQDSRREYTEGLTLRPLPHVGKAVAHFHFDLTTTSAASSQAHFDVFPQSLRHVVQKYNVEDLELTFTTGLWRHEQWGSILGNGPHGVSLQATMHDPSHWTGLTQQLAGLFSASLNKMDASTVYTTNSSSSTTSIHGMLPREELCTENLSPWLKMLPCRTHGGLGAWVRPVTLLDSDFLSLKVRVVHDHGTLRLHQSLTVVRRVDPTWSLQSLLGLTSSLTSACALARSSVVATDLAFVGSSATSPGTRNNPVDHSTLHQVSFASAAATTPSPWLVRSDSESDSTSVSTTWRGVSGHRYLTGYGQVRGGIGLQLTNHHPTNAIHVAYHETMPWYLRVYFSTVRLRLNGVDVDPLTLPSFHVTVPTSSSQHKHLRAPYELHFAVEIAPLSQLSLAYSFDKTFLPMGAHPPDSNRGFDVPPASWTVDGVTYFTEPLLVPLPTPDFSMPYNVIVLTSTVVGMSIAIVVNTLLNHERRTNLLLTLVHKLKRAFASANKNKEKSD
ncbi:hypothetical protein DYB25_012524 [Aphanomyces astaci]|uniref:GPI transamidase component PIG-T n=2 Tax=Aphanomyces astaci TaxID=112090 RepID=A0A397EFI1_APHAT|nr:hypothetical protein DYB25_012524 [Aphanomyces astaci]RHY48704.1 hypothetical protein DYB38_013203 [Aphanomyces astaci]RHY62079.1 hypothetical protein DYB34_003276 [Aphanomyces astaci]RHY78304.1 hypothetical protein DYB30_007179 [Aphanomyces astaci]RHZ10350.1 hypothetical protein DYB26_002665 [Aphanomyces astaci]